MLTLNIEKCATCGRDYEPDVSTLFGSNCPECAAKLRREAEIDRIKRDPKCFVYHKKVYTVGKEPSPSELQAHPNWYGFGGRAWEIKPLNGEPFITHNLYYTGEVDLDDTCTLKELK